jgi:hypothetical protein
MNVYTSRQGCCCCYCSVPSLFDFRCFFPLAVLYYIVSWSSPHSLSSLPLLPPKSRLHTVLGPLPSARQSAPTRPFSSLSRRPRGLALVSSLTLFLFFSPLLSSPPPPPSSLRISSPPKLSLLHQPPSPSLSLPLLSSSLLFFSPLLSPSSFLFLIIYPSLSLQESFVRRVSKKCVFGFCSLSASSEYP